MKPVPLHQQRSLSEVHNVPSSHRLSLFGRTEFRRAVVILPEMPYPLSRQKRGRWLTADLPPKDPMASGTTVIRCGLGSDVLLDCLADVAAALGPAFRTHEYIFLGTAISLAARPLPVSTLTPSAYWLADAHAAMSGRLSILYRHPFMGITQEARLTGAIMTMPTACVPQIIDATRDMNANIMVDSQAFWFAAFMNTRSIVDYSVRILPQQALQVAHERDQTDTLTLAHAVKKELERLQVSRNDAVAAAIS